MSRIFSLRRFLAMAGKEFVQMRRDRMTFAMMIGIPLLQLVLFGFAINSDPRHLPLAVLSADQSRFSRAIVWGMKNSSYFDPVQTVESRAEASELLRMGEVQFVLTIPERFGRRILRGDRPVLLLEADATDPSATSNAVRAFSEVVDLALARELTGPYAELPSGRTSVDVRLHSQYNPEAKTQYNIVPGLMGVILTMTLVIITALAITRERERGTMENLLSTPVRPFEVMAGKIMPYIFVGYLQVGLIILAARFLFQVPFHGSVALLLAFSFVFIAANLAVGVTFSTVARNQLQAMQMSFFFFLPSILLSGFMFPFRGMPGWAQVIGEGLPLTHYLRMVRGILLKGYGPAEAAAHLWPMAVFLVAVLALGAKRYRRTLD